jgi:hypothetical protein
VRAAARAGLVAVIALGVCVQVLAISVDHHRFFFDRSLPRFFWYTHPYTYFHESALLARPAELETTIIDGVPREAEAFRPGPYSARLTYAVFGGWSHPELSPPRWMRLYRVFWLPRPWPLWMRTIPPAERPVDMPAALSAIAVAMLAGVGMLMLMLPPRKGGDTP